MASGSTFEVPRVWCSVTFTAGTLKEVDVDILSDIPQSSLDRIPPRNRNILRGTVDFVSAYYGTVGGGVATDVLFFGNNSYLSSVTDAVILGGQDFASGDFLNSTSYVYADAQNVSLPYRDEDETGQFHIRIESGAAGGVQGVIRFCYLPEVPY